MHNSVDYISSDEIMVKLEPQTVSNHYRFIY